VPSLPSGLEGQVVALSDTIAYVCHDLDDGLNAGLISSLFDERLISKKSFNKIMYDSFGLKPNSGISALINTLVIDVVESSWEIINKNNIASIDQVRSFSDEKGNKIVRLGKHEEAFRKLKKFVGDNIYQSPMTTIMDVKAQKIVSEIYNTYWNNPKQLPNHVYKKFIDADKASDKSSGAAMSCGGYKITPRRVLCDHIAEMTDRSALETYDKLFGLFTKI
jgi:dGTPase